MPHSRASAKRDKTSSGGSVGSSGCSGSGSGCTAPSWHLWWTAADAARLARSRRCLGPRRERLGVLDGALLGRCRHHDVRPSRCRAGCAAPRHRLWRRGCDSARCSDGCRGRGHRRRGRADRPRTAAAARGRHPHRIDVRAALARRVASTSSVSINGIWGGNERALDEAHRVLKPGGGHWHQLLGDGPSGRLQAGVQSCCRPLT